MNILYITVQNLKRPGGARSHVLGFCRGLRSLGVNVQVVSPYDTIEEAPPADKPIGHRARHLLRLLVMHRKIVRAIESGWPDVVYYRRGYVNPGLFTAFRTRNLPVFLEMNGILENESFDFARHLVSRASAVMDQYRFLKADLLVAVSDGIKQHLLTTYKGIDPGKILVVINGVNTDVFYPKDRLQCRKELGMDPEVFTLVFAGKVAVRHGLNTAVKAIEILRDKSGGPIALYVVGDGPALAELKKDVESAGLQDRIHFTGMQPQNELTRYIGAADVCISPHSAWPTNSIGVSPLKIFEYLACGRPIICSEVKGISRIMDELGEQRNSITLVPPDDAASLARAIEAAMTSGSANPDTIGKIREKISWQARSGAVYEEIRRFKDTATAYRDRERLRL